MSNEIVLAIRLGPSSAAPTNVAVELARATDARSTVLYFADELDARYIGVGTRGRGALARLVLGDTVQAILQRTPCPVVVVPHGDAAG